MATNALIQTLMDKIFTALLHQAQFAIDFRDQLEAMKTKFELGQAFLSSTDNQTGREEILQKLLPNLRKLIYEADDILTDCQIRDACQKERSCWSFSPRGLVFQNKTCRKLTQINSRMEKMETSMGLYFKPQQPINIDYPAAYRSIAYSSQEYDPSEIIGLESDMEKIKGWIFSNNEEVNRVGIVGMGGLGKTTLAQKIFNDGEIVACFEKMIWLKISQDFSEGRIMKAMLKQLGHEDSMIDESHLLNKIHQILGDKTCLIIMDDVWKMNLDWWNKLCPATKRIAVVITSRDLDVTTSMGVNTSRIHQPKTLNMDESWLLFSKFAFSSSRGICPNYQFERVGRDVLEKCGGLPLAIKTIGALLAQKIYSLGQWKVVNDNFRELLTSEGKNDVMASLQLSYDELPSFLKPCLLCFSIYPEDFEISAEQIVHWWVGEGFIQGGETKTATELGFEYLLELVNRCLIEVVNRRGYDGRVYSCKMQQLVRDMTIKIANDEGFCFFNEQGKLKLKEDSRWFSFTRESNKKSLKTCSRLRALLLISSIPDSPDTSTKFLMSLRVLDFSYSKLETINLDDLLVWICSLKRLAHLNLSGISGLKEVPYSIQRLRNLQILILRKCNNLANVNPSITNLKRLTVLDIGFYALRYLPCGLGKLIHLQELSRFRVVGQANAQSCRLRHLLNLEQLRVLRISVNDESEILENERNVLSQLKKLKVLDIDAENAKRSHVSEIVDQLLPPPSLQELYIRRYRHKTLPNWINPKHLPNLKYLYLEDGDISSFQMSSDAWIVEGICLNFMPNLVLDWTNSVKVMPFLRYAEVSHCFNLKYFPYPSDKPVVWRKNDCN